MKTETETESGGGFAQPDWDRRANTTPVTLTPISTYTNMLAPLVVKRGRVIEIYAERMGKNIAGTNRLTNHFHSSSDLAGCTRQTSYNLYRATPTDPTIYLCPSHETGFLLKPALLVQSDITAFTSLQSVNAGFWGRLKDTCKFCYIALRNRSYAVMASIGDALHEAIQAKFLASGWLHTIDSKPAIEVELNADSLAREMYEFNSKVLGMSGRMDLGVIPQKGQDKGSTWAAGEIKTITAANFKDMRGYWEQGLGIANSSSRRWPGRGGGASRGLAKLAHYEYQVQEMMRSFATPYGWLIVVSRGSGPVLPMFEEIAYDADDMVEFRVAANLAVIQEGLEYVAYSNNLLKAGRIAPPQLRMGDCDYCLFKTQCNADRGLTTTVSAAILPVVESNQKLYLEEYEEGEGVPPPMHTDPDPVLEQTPPPPMSVVVAGDAPLTQLAFI